ncbi:hypothetical protein TVAG_052640 [Trichomonas vaginalis G3]|uniref:receptor protein-tyrosine kinase n=1 Tax=Trichomonas vaginalis (strain ATCC PRA-98 / G3) TaxID=412133 RepID=A2G5Y8_TRIV3|nr:glycine-rich protein family [Trichomonas vaginalis G3]EAX87428.1 hypothetical protein TVAG_052640 [Trichomonas vaginalis G3]KAI5506096.1 glycine-rich protein family [Trichomonas vaginalis G3]|eukprot:XP_001300358.1 hypothetical protein [Trichomonas vaginalis G3]
MNGGTQLQGGFASKVNKFGTYVKPGYDGLFGMSTNVNISNWGGIAGNGYWSGGSPAWAGAGGGGSSFVSGHEGCIALNSSENENPNPNNSSVHYSNIAFLQPSMHRGNTTMPLYYSPNAYGIGNKGRGCIRITILSFPEPTCRSFLSFSFNILLISVFIVM